MKIKSKEGHNNYRPRPGRATPAKNAQNKPNPELINPREKSQEVFFPPHFLVTLPPNNYCY
jgi:hypothetical protein